MTPAARRADRSQGQLGGRRRGHDARDEPARRAGARGLRGGQAAARRRRGDPRQDEHARARDLGDTDGADKARPATRGTPDRTPGGSSGGSAAAVAAGLAPAAMAPTAPARSAFPPPAAGSSGLKAQRDRLPLGPDEHWHGLSVAGSCTRSVEDTALLLAVGRRRRRRCSTLPTGTPDAHCGWRSPRSRRSPARVHARREARGGADRGAPARTRARGGQRRSPPPAR